ALPTGLSVGSYSGRITLTAVIDTLTVAVRFDVTAAPTLTGRWALIADTINVGLVLADASGTVTGTGNFNAPDARRRFFSVHGTAQSPAVRLTLTETDSTRVSFTGSLVNDDRLRRIAHRESRSERAVGVLRILAVQEVALRERTEHLQRDPGDDERAPGDELGRNRRLDGGHDAAVQHQRAQAQKSAPRVPD